MFLLLPAFLSAFRNVPSPPWAIPSNSVHRRPTAWASNLSGHGSQNSSVCCIFRRTTRLVAKKRRKMSFGCCWSLASRQPAATPPRPSSPLFELEATIAANSFVRPAQSINFPVGPCCQSSPRPPPSLLPAARSPPLAGCQCASLLGGKTPPMAVPSCCAHISSEVEARKGGGDTTSSRCWPPHSRDSGRRARIRWGRAKAARAGWQQPNR